MGRLFGHVVMCLSSHVVLVSLDDVAWLVHRLIITKIVLYDDNAKNVYLVSAILKTDTNYAL